MGDAHEQLSMTTPQLSPPAIISSEKIKQNVKLAKSIRDLCNQAFSRHKHLDPVKWNSTTLRFPDMQIFYNMLTPESVFALVFDQKETTDVDSNEMVGKTIEEDEASGDNAAELKADMGSKVIACAAAVPWCGGWAREGASTETGWEIKTICVDADPCYLRKGLAIQVLRALESHLVDKARSSLRADGMEVERGQMDLWVLAAECINGSYWRKRGYERVRSKIEGVGVWSCTASFEMTVFRKTVSFNMAG